MLSNKYKGSNILLNIISTNIMWRSISTTDARTVEDFDDQNILKNNKSNIKENEIHSTRKLQFPRVY